MINAIEVSEATGAGTVSQSLDDPIAIIGIGCRFPGGVDSPGSFWELLKSGADGIIEVPSDRWDINRFYDSNPSTLGKMYVRAGGFLKQRIDQFDALFFGISPREAGFIDPQQRILMEVAWEALEDAGLDPEQLAGTDTGVYIGGFMLDNLLTQFSPLNREQIGSHSAVGSTLTILSNRLSYIFDLRGPSITMDTACSSSLVALHEACQSIWRGECTLGLCGGVNIMHRPENLIAMCKGGFLSPDGRSKSFDKRANGYGRGEGAGLVVLKPYSAALRDGDDIYAIVRGTGANQDGRTDGITVPNPEAQEMLMRRVCAKVKVDPRQICYVEAHGTGTPVGDPLEARAIGAVMGQNRKPHEACLVGSVKANIGHLEAASGVAGLIKLALCLRHNAIPPLANLVEANPNIPFAELGLRLPLALEPIPDRGYPPLAAINSFGYGGTNAHALLQAHRAPSPATSRVGLKSPDLHLLPLSARSKAALVDLAKAYKEQLLHSEDKSFYDLCYSAALRRGHHDHRAALVAGNREAMAAQLQHFVEHGDGPGISSAAVPAKGQKPVFVFTGMGPQTWSMGRELFLHEPVFRDFAEKCDRIFQRVAGWSILAEMLRDEKSSRISETQIAQPANFVIQAGLAVLWRSWGVEPSAVVGHSVGEVTSAYLSGILSLEDAVTVSCHRSRIQKKAAGIGTMLAVGLAAADVAAYLAKHGAKVSLAAANGPKSITLAGDAEVLKEIAAELQPKGIFNRFLTVEVAYHSHTMDPLKPEVLEVLADLTICPPVLPIYSTVTGERVDGWAYDAPYWCRNIREPVQFEKAMSSLVRDGHRLFLEVGPHPVLSTSIKECLAHHGVQGVLLASLRRDKPDRATMLEALAGLYTAGAMIDWNKRYADGGHYTKLPRYPWQREVYWSESDVSFKDRVGSYRHALLGSKADGPGHVWESILNSNSLPYLPDHRVENLVILPGAAYIELGLAIRQELDGQTQVCLEDLEFHKALIIGSAAQPRLHADYDQVTRSYAIFSREKEGAAWTSHARGRLSFLPLGQPGRVAIEDVRSRCTQPVEAQAHYEDMHRRGLQYGPYFQGVRELWLRPDGQEVLARIEGHAALAASAHQHLLHPSLLDSCFQSLLAGLGAKGDHNVYVPVKVAQVRFYRSPQGGFWCYSKFTDHQENSLEGDVVLFDDEGTILAEVCGVRAQALSNKTHDEIKDIDRWLYKFSWEEKPLENEIRNGGRWLVFADKSGIGVQLAEELSARGAEDVIMVQAGLMFQEHSACEYCIRPDNSEDFKRLLERVYSAPLRGVVYLWSLDVAERRGVGTQNVVSSLYLVQALAHFGEIKPDGIFFVTQLAQPVLPDQTDISVVQAPVIGFVRVAINEFHEQRFRLVDIAPGPDLVPRLADEISSNSREEEVALREHGRYVNRLDRCTTAELAATGKARELEASSAAGESSVERPAHLPSRRRPGPGEIEVGLSVVALSRHAAEGAMPNFAGAEAFGVVTATGSGVETMKSGDRVMVRLQEERLTRYITVPAARVYQIKTMETQGVEPVQVTPLVTAYYALHRLAALEKGERVLIHDAASSVGLAAIEVARWRQATIYATASSVEERSHLSTLGLAQVYDSNSSAFADEITALVGKNGLDVILNTFGGEMAQKTLALLGPFGRCVTIKEMEESELILSLPFSANQWVARLDSYQLRIGQPVLFDRVVAEIGDHLALGHFKAVPTRRLQLSAIDQVSVEAEAALPGLQLIDLESLTGTTFENGSESVYHERFRPDGAYLITGGFGGFGLEIAKWLVTQGARNLVLVGRSGPNTPECRQALQTLRAAGVHLLSVAADISEEADVDRLFAEIARAQTPLRGVFHAAAVLDDGAIRLLSPSKLEVVMKPKAKGAWLLHQRTCDLALDYFVLFSSIGSLVGNPGQAPYVSANAFLDALAHYRRGKNLPAICINWGALGQIGMAARQKGVEDYLNRMGFGSFTPTQAIKVLEKILEWKPVHVGAALMNWQVVKKSYPTWAEALRNSIVMADDVGEKSANSEQSPLHALSQLRSDARSGAISELFIELISSILKIPAKKIDSGQSLLNMGMDSLMGIEIQAAIERKMGLKVSTLELMKGNSLADLTEHLVSLVDLYIDAKGPTEKERRNARGTSEPPAPPKSVDALVAAKIEDVDSILDLLSDEEVAQALELLNNGETK